jgi:hypothetical protein
MIDIQRKFLKNPHFIRTKMKIALINQMSATANAYRIIKDPFSQGTTRTDSTKTIIVMCYGFIISDNFHGLLKYLEVE